MPEAGIVWPSSGLGESSFKNVLGFVGNIVVAIVGAFASADKIS